MSRYCRHLALLLALSLLLPLVVFPRALAADDLVPLAAFPGHDGYAEDAHAVPGRPGDWLVAASDALLVVTAAGATPILDGRFESLDARSGITIDGRAAVMVSMVDTDAGAVRLAVLAAKDLSVIEDRLLPSPLAVAGAQCLGRDPETGHLSVYVLDDRHLVSQRLVWDGPSEQFVDIEVRQLPGFPEAEACAVADEAGGLFVVEEPLGVWRYDTDAETDGRREAVLLREPHGQLADDVTDLAIDAHGTLWVLSSDAGAVVRLSPSAETRRWSLPAEVSAGFLVAGSDGAGAVPLAVFDEVQNRLLVSGSLSGTADPARASNTRGGHRVAIVTAARETEPVRRYGDAADDPAIYVDPEYPQRSLIIGTDKREGLAVYDLAGRQVQFLAAGRLNNVDVLVDLPLGEERRTVVAASNRTLDTITLFELRGGRLTRVADIPTGLEDVYGLCMYRGNGDVGYVFINATDGRYEQHRLSWEGGGVVGERVRAFRLPSQPEGCVAEPAGGRVYLGEEAAGIWMAGAEPDGVPPRRIIDIGDHLVADVEGLALYHGADRTYLVASSQGSDSYAVYEVTEDFPLVGSFRIGADVALAIDGASETDGLEVTSAELPGFPRGLLVVQDGRNRMPTAPQNFKLVDWRSVEAVLARPPR